MSGRGLARVAAVAGFIAVTLGVPCAAQYGDVNADGRVTAADVKMILAYSQGRRYGDVRDLRIRRYGDISPRLSSTTFGDSLITVPDAVRALRRSAGLEADQPAPDFWPLGRTDGGGAGMPSASYSYRDQFGSSSLATIDGPYVWDGHDIYVYSRTDGTEYDLFKDAAGDLYLVGATITLGNGTSPGQIAFSTPIPLVRMKTVACGAPLVTTWSGETTGDAGSYGIHPVTYTITLMRRESAQVSAAGALPFDGTVVLRFAFALNRTPTNSLESQQSWFFWLAPYVGPVQEGRAATQDVDAPDTTAKSLWQAQTAAVAAKSYP